MSKEELKELLLEAYQEGNNNADMPSHYEEGKESDFNEWYENTVKNNVVLDIVSESVQADIRNKLQPLQTLADLVNEGAEYDWLTDQLPKTYEVIEYLSNLNSSR
tara:strand:- start:52 stop:366 length:315 start_codon:yes stop_codon:yes gene_type:complete